jgi:hypothetical protein
MPALIVRVAANLDELRKNLAEGKSQIETTTAAMSKLASSFSGDRLIQSAQNTVAAVNAIGGATKLSGVEQERVNTLLEKALEKYRALGQQAPAGMQQLADATRRADDAGQSWSSMLGKASGLLSALGIGITVSALVNFAKGLLADADALVKLRDKTGISIEGLQAMRIAGDDAGVSLDSMTAAVNMLQKRLGGDDASANAALKDLGINIAAFKALDGSAQMAMLSDAVRGMNDPLRVASDLSALFGKSWADQLPALKRGFDEVRDGTAQMSTQSAEAIDAWGDSAAATWRSMKANFGEAIADILTLSLSATRQLESDIDRIAAAADKAAPKVKGLAAPGLPADLDAINAKFDAQAKIINERMTPAAVAHRAAMVELNAVGVGWNGTLDTIDGTVVEAIKHYLDAGVSQGTLATAYGLTAVQIKAVSTAMSEELATAKVLADFKSTAAAHQAVLDAKAMKGVDDMIAAMFKKKQADRDFLDTELKIALAQDAANLAMGNAPAAIKPIKPALDEATQAAGVFMQQLTMLVTDPNTAGFFGLDAKGSVAQTLFGGGHSGLSPEMAAAMAAGQFINTAGVGSVQRRASGGPVSSGAPYIVGERGPEMFVPGSSGSIVANGGGGTTIVNNFYITQPLGTPDAIARAVGPAVIASLKNSGTRLPVRT